MQSAGIFSSMRHDRHRSGRASGRQRRRQGPGPAGSRAATAVETGHAGGHRRLQAGAHRAAPAAHAGGQASARQAQASRTASRSSSMRPAFPTRRTLATGRQGNRFRVEPTAGQGARHRHQGRQARGEGHCLRPPSAERHRTFTTARSTSPSFTQISRIDKIEDSLDSPPKPAVILDDLPKDEPHGWKYLDRRTRREALFPGRRALQHLPAIGAPHQDLSRRPRRQGPRGLRPRHSPDRRHGLASDVEAALFLRELARLAVGGRARGQAQSRHPARQGSLRLPYCHQGNFTDPEFGWGRSCSEFTGAGRPGRPAFGRARHEVLHGQRPWR